MRLSPFIISLSLLTLAACATQAAPLHVGQSGAEFKETTGSGSSAVTLQSGSGASVTERLLSGGILEFGKATAPVSMLLFMNHDSDYSRQFMQTLLPRLFNDFASKGKVQIGIVPVQLQKYPQSGATAVLMLCAATQGKGSAMNDLLFSQENSAAIQKLMGTLGLDLPRLQACLQSAKVQGWLKEEATLAQSFNITLVPTYTINSAVFTGLPEYADLKGQVQAAIDGR